MSKRYTSLFSGFLLLFFIPFAQLHAQCNIEEINLELIPHKTVREYIKSQSQRNISSFDEITPSWSSASDSNEFNTQKKSYVIKENIAKVWNKYLTTSPAESWNGKKVKFGFMYSKKQNAPLYTSKEFNEIDTGQVIFLNLKLLGFYNLAMAFEIIAVDVEEKIIEFSYIEGNVSQGKQRLQFVDTPDGHTEIIHSSYFKSESKMRDKILYPFFHTRTTNEFHRIMKKLIKGKKQKQIQNIA